MPGKPKLKSTVQITDSMEETTERFNGISEQTETLRQESNQMLTAMRTIESITETIMQDAATISGETVKNLVRYAEVLQQIVDVFKLS